MDIEGLIVPVLVGLAIEKAVNRMELDFSDVKPTVLSALTIFLIVVVTVNLGKFLATKYHIPGLSELILNT